MMRGNLHTLWSLWFSKRNLKDLVFFINIKIWLIHWSFTVNAGLRSVEPHYITVYIFLLIFILIKLTNSLHIINLESSLPRVKTVDWFFNWSNLVDNLIVVVVVGEISPSGCSWEWVWVYSGGYIHQLGRYSNEKLHSTLEDSICVL